MTEKILSFNLQLFALPDTPTISASESNVVVEGSSTETGETSIVTETEATVLEAIAAFYAPAEGDTQDYEDITYTYTNGAWQYDTTTTTAAATEIAETLDALYNPTEGDSQEYEGVTYTYTNGEWTYEEATTVTLEDAAILATITEFYAPNEGDSQEYENITYTYTDGAWTYEDTETATADEAVTAAIIDEHYSPSEGDTQEYENVTYTYTDGNWTYESELTLVLTDTDTLTAIALLYLPNEGDTYELDGTTYTYTDGDWTYQTTETTTADEEQSAAAAAAYLAANLSEGDTQTYDDITYTYDGSDWTYVTTETAAASADIAATLNALYNPVEGDTYELDGITYTYTAGEWTYSDTFTAAATAEIADAIIAAYYTPSEGATQTLDGITYTYTDGNWTYLETTTETASEEQAAAALEAYLDENLVAGTTVDFDGDTYTYDGAAWYDSADGIVIDIATIAGIGAAFLTQNLSEDATAEVDGTTYTYDGSSWTYEYTETVNVEDADIYSALMALYTPSEGDTQTYDDITYTYDGSDWTYTYTDTAVAAADIADQINATYDPSDGDTQDLAGITYTYDGANWNYDEEVTNTATAEVAAAIIAAYYTPSNGDSVDVEDITYTYSDGDWTYEDEVTETAAADIASQIISTYYPKDGDTQEIDGVTYTFDAEIEEWSYTDTVAVNAEAEIAAAIIAEYYTPSEGDTQDYEGVTYTYDGANWNYENEVTATADEAVAAAIIAEYYTPGEGDTQEVDGVSYTYDGANWNYDTDVTQTAASSTTAAIISEYYSPSEGDTQELDGVTYTYTDGAWLYNEDVTETASAEIATAIIAEYYSAAEGDTQKVDGTTYTYNGTDWTYEETATITSYYQFSDSVSSADAPVVIQDAETTGDLENTSLSSPTYIKGTGEDIIIEGVGVVSGLEDDEYIAVTAAEGTAALTGLKGDINFAGSGKNVSLSLNDAEINYTTAEKGEVVNFVSTGTDVTAQAEGAVTLKSIDENQIWELNNTAEEALTFGKVAYHADGEVVVSAADSNASVLSTTLDDGESLVMGKDGSGRTDIVQVNGVTVSSAAKAGGTTSSTITAEDDVLVISVGDRGGNVTINNDVADLAVGASATVEGTGSDAAITAVDALDPNGKWITDEEEIYYDGKIWANNSSGAVTLTADSEDGSSIAKVNFSSGTVALNQINTNTAVATSAVNVNGKATWEVEGRDDNFDDFAVFDANGNVTLTNDDRYSGSATLTSGKNVTFTSGTTGDILTVSKGAKIDVIGELAVNANSLAAGSSWSVKAETAGLGDQTLYFEEDVVDSGTGIRAVVTADSRNGSVIRNISQLAGNVTLGYEDDEEPNSLTVGNSTWTISGDADNSVIFDTDGDVTVNAGGDELLTVNGTYNAEDGVSAVVVSNDSANAKLNGVTVKYTGSEGEGVEFELEEKAHNAGISKISSVDGFITVSGDNSYIINGNTYANAARGDATIYATENSTSVQNVQDKDIITLTGGGSLYFGEVENKTANVTVNGAGVTLSATTADDIDLIGISVSDNGTISGFSGVDVTTTINTGDNSFSVSYLTPDSDTGVVLNVNDMQIGIGADADYDSDTFGLSVNGTDVTLTGVSFGTADTLTVSGGNYKIGKSAAVAVTETLGYITFDQHGNATAIEKSVADNEKAREGVIDSVEAAASIVAPPVLVMYQKLGTEDSGAPAATIAGFDDAMDSTAATSSVEGGINLYGDTSLNSTDLKAVTLQSFTDDDIVVFEDPNTSILTSVIDVSKGTPSVVAIDPTNTTGVDHTVLGGDNGNYIKFGANARGDNYAQAGSVASYLANEGGTATLIGGAGNDSIAAKKGDKVTGGAGADYFFDANGAYLISDYSAAQGDVLVASKLADINKNLDAETLVDKIAVKGNTINIAGGGKFTLGGSGSESSDATITALNVRFTDSNAQDIHKLTWAAADGGNVNTSAFSEGSVLMVADQNNGASDSVVGSSGNDTIFVGGNDTVNAGSGKDEIYITAANSAKKEEGAVVELSSGRTYVHGWDFGFDNSTGANILNADANSLTFDNKEDTLIAYNANDTIYFVDNDSTTEVFDLLIGTPDDSTKLSYLRSSKNVQIASSDDIADMYYTAADVNATLTFTDGVGDIGDTISLEGGNYSNIHNVVLTNNGAATLVGTDDKDVLVLGGEANADSRKHVSLGGGNDSLVSGGTSTSVAGNTIYFGLESDGSDIVDNFGYYQGAAADPDKVAADKIIVYNWNEGTSAITANGKNIEIKVDGNSKLTLHEDAGINANNKIVYQLGYDGEERIMQVGQTSGAKNNFTYDKETFVYVGNQEGAADTLSIAANDDNVAVWLDNHHGAVYEGIGVIDASASTNTQLTLAGGAGNNTITAGGEGNSTSLWGGGYGDNELIAGAGNDVFFFTKSGSNDTITGIDAINDRVRLGDITLDDLVQGQAYFDGDDVKIELKAESGGGSLTIKNAAGVQVEVNKGDGSYHAYTATKSGSDWSWQG